jgi:dihydrofolate reductase
MKARWHAIAAMASNRVIGRGGVMPWHLPDDLKFFKQTTLGCPVVMGRKTWESLGRPLPGRRNIVLSRGLGDVAGAEVVGSVEALDGLGLEGDVFVIGGAEIYRLLLERCVSVYLTVLAGPAEGDAFMPAFEEAFPVVAVIGRQPGVAEWRRYERKRTLVP